ITLNTSAAEVYLNGAKLNKGNTWILPAIDGRNRMVLLYKVRRSGSREVGYLFPQPGKIKEFIQVRP
ncbi:MAG: hypothetical protein JXR78_03690, partial [Victivallales bacterium]|nr:hypothetical protein [Victivallales bacterium]